MRKEVLTSICLVFILIVLAGCLGSTDAQSFQQESLQDPAQGTAAQEQQDRQAGPGVVLPDSAAQPAEDGEKGYEDEEDDISDKSVEEYQPERDEIDAQIDESLDLMTGAAVSGLSEIDPRVSELLERAEKVSQIRYYLSESPDLHIKSQYFVRDERMKIILPEPPAFARGKYYNAIYLDNDAGKAEAYCEDEKRCDDLNQKFDVEYEEYQSQTPRDWALFVAEDAEVLGTEALFNRDVTQVQFEKEGRTYKVWLYNYHGVAAKVVEDAGSRRPHIMFFELISTHVSDEQVEHQYVDR